MKRKVLLFLITMFAMLGSRAYATDYNLWVVGVQVTSSNASNVQSYWIQNGFVRYDAESNTLTLEHVSIHPSSLMATDGIRSEIPNLKIVLIESNEIDCYGDGIISDGNLTIEGTGSLSLTSPIRMTSGNLVVRQCELSLVIVHGANCGIDAAGDCKFMEGCNVTISSHHCIQGTQDKRLVIDYATLNASIPLGVLMDYSIFSGFSNLNQYGVVMLRPRGAHYNSSTHNFEDPMEEVPRHAYFIPESAITSYLAVAGNELRGNSGVYHFPDIDMNGSATYNFSTNTLTLDNAEISPLSGISGIVSGIPDLKIELIGSNSIEADYNGIYSYGNLNLCGTGALEIDVDFYAGIEVESGNLSIDNCIVTSNVSSLIDGRGISVQENCTIKNAACVYAKGYLAGIQGSQGKTLSVQDASLQALVPSSGRLVSAISGFSHLEITQPSDIYPADASYDETDRRMESNGNVVTRVCIDPRNTGLWVAGIRVNGNNSIFNFTGEGITGSVEYTLRTKELTLTNATISGVDGFAIRSNVPGLKIKLVGSNAISRDCGIVASRNFEMHGEGTLRLSNEGHGILALDDLVISQCSVNSSRCSAYGNLSLTNNSALNAYGSSSAISGQKGKTLTVNDSYLTASCSSNLRSVIDGFSRLTMVGTNITNPLNGYYDETARGLKTSSGTNAKNVTIEGVNHSLWVAGHKLEGESGTYTFTGQGITSGSVIYNFSTNTLTLDNAVISAGSEYGIKSYLPNLTLELVGDNSIAGTSYGGYFVDNTTIHGTGSLDINVSDQYGFYADGDVTIDGCAIDVKSTSQSDYAYGIYAKGNFTIQGAASVTAEAYDYAIYGQQGKTLSVNRSDVYAKNTYSSASAISGFAHLSLTDTYFTYPIGVTYDESDRRLETSSGSNVHEAVIETVNHSLWVAGHKLEGESGTYTFTGQGITSGSVTYNFSTNTLTLDNAVISAGSEYGIKSFIPNLTLELVGDNSIAGTSYGAYSVGNMTIQGTGSLDINVSGQYGFYAAGDVTVDGCTLNVKSTYPNSYSYVYGIYAKGDFTIQGAASVTAEAYGYAIYGQQGKTLSVNGSDVYAKNNSSSYESAIRGFSHLTMTGTSLIYPIGGTYDESDRRLETSSGSNVHEAVIETINHSLWVAGYKLEGESGTYTFTGQVITSGSVTYNFSTNTLTLDNAVISAGSEYGIRSFIPNLTLELVGDNSIAGTSSGAYSFEDMTIQGTGSLDINVSGQYGFYANGDVTVDGCTLNVKSTYTNSYSYAYGIYAKGDFTIQGAASVTAEAYDYAISGQQGKTLSVNGSDLYAKNTYSSASAISGFSHLSLTGTYLTYPVGGAYDESDRRLETSGGSYVHEAVIETVTHSLWVAGHKLEGESGTYTFTGQGITSGSITYNFSTNTLTLDNAVINAGSDYGIKSYIPNLTLELVGGNSIAGSSCGAYSFDNTAIHGTGSLDINVSGQYGFYANGDVTVDGCALSVKSTHQGFYSYAYGIYAKGDFTIQDAASVTAEAFGYAIYGQQGKTLSVNGSDLYAKNTYGSASAISGFSHLSLTDTSLTYPIGGTYNETYRRLETPSESYVHEAVIETVNRSLWVAGHKLESESDTYTFSGSGITSGSVTYNFSNNTLTLDNATINAGSNYGIENGLDGLTIVLVGTNRINGSSNGVYSMKTSSFQGSGTLSVNVSGTYGIYVTSCVVSQCTINVKTSNSVNADVSGIRATGSFTVNENALVTADATYRGCGIYVNGICTIEGNANVSATGYDIGVQGVFSYNIIVNGGNLYAKNTSSINSVIQGFSDLVMSGGSHITMPNGASYHDLRMELYDAFPVSEVAIEVDNHSLWVAGHKLEGNNGTYAFSGSGITSGSVTYDFSTNTLTLNNANIDCNSGSYGIKNYIPNLKIELVGNNTISASSYGIYSSSWSNLTIYGFGHLNVDVPYDYGIYVHDNLTVKQCVLHVEKAATLYVVNRYYGLYVFGDLSLSNVSEVTSEVSQNNSTDGSTAYAYGVYVSGSVTMTNFSDLTGRATFTNHENKHSYGIYVSDGFTVTKSHVTATSSETDGIYVGGDFVVQGEGDVWAASNGTAINVLGTFGLHNGSTLYADGLVYGVRGTSDKTFTVIRSAIRAYNANSSEHSAIEGFNVVTWSGTDVILPEGGRYNANDNQMVDANGNVAHEVEFAFPTYPVYVAGVQVTGANAADVRGDGTVSYDNSTHTLTLNNADILSHGWVGIRNEFDGLKINLIGENTILDDGTSGIISLGAMTFMGTGTLTVTGLCGIHTSSNLTLQGGCTLNANGTGSNSCSAILCHGSDNTLTIDHSTLDATCPNTLIGTLTGFTTLNLNGSTIVRPAGSMWSSELRCLTKYGQKVFGEVIIDYREFDLYVAGVRVTSANADDVLGDGTVSFNATTQTLTLNNTYVHNANVDGIKTTFDNLTIMIYGSNYFDVGNHYGLDIETEGEATITFTGPGHLQLIAFTGILASDPFRKVLSITNGCHVHVTATQNGVQFYPGRVQVDHASLSVNGANYCISTNWLDMVETSILAPDGAEFNQLYGTVVYAGTTTAVSGEYVRIAPQPYNLWVADIQVNEAIADDVLGDGKVSYDASQNVLTLNGVDIDATTYGIRAGIEDLTLRLVGTNNVEGRTYGIFAEDNLIIEGAGILNVSGRTGIICYHVDVNGNHYPVNLTIKDGCTVNASGSTIGIIGTEAAIKGDTPTNSTLTISNCKVTASCPGTPIGTIHGFSNLVMNNVDITSPSGAAWNASLHCVATNGTPVTEQVVFSPRTFNLYVKGQQVNYCNAFDVLADGGSVTYDWTENVLTLNNATIESNTDGIKSQIQGLRIDIIGNNTIVASMRTTAVGGIYLQGNTTIAGTGTLDVSGWIGINTTYNLTIQGGCTVNASVNSGRTLYPAIAGSSGKTLTINGSRVTATVDSGNQHSVISGFSNLVLNNVAVTEPARATYSTTNRQLETSNHSIVTGTAVIEGIPYDIWINGVQLNSLNCQHFTDNSIEGEISYDHSDNTLTLNNATINYIESYTPTIKNAMDYLKIKLIGQNFLNGYDFVESYAMEVHSGQGWMVIEGPGTLMSNSSIVFADGGCRLDIEEGALVNLYSIGQEDDASLRSIDGSFIDLTIDGAALMAHKVKDLYRTNLGPYAYITAPSGATFLQDGNGLYYVSYSGEEAENVVIENTYGIFVANTPVTSRNAQHVEGDGIMGNISYNMYTRTLTLDNATVNAQNDGLESYLEDETLTISLIGHNTISGARGCGILLQNSAIIEAGDASGDDWLTVSGSDGILMESSGFLTIQGGCHIETSATYSGWQAGLYADGQGQDLTISNSYVVAHNLSGNPCSAITGFGDVILNGVGVLQPYGAEWEDDNFLVGDTYVNDIEIGYAVYDLKVAGIPVTSVNAHQITGNGISGNVWYDAQSNILNLEDATIDVSQSNVYSAIENHINGLTINVIGYDNMIRGAEDGISLFDCNTTITRNDTESSSGLNVVAPYGIVGYDDDAGGAGAALTISNGVSVTVASEQNGFYVKDVTIDKSTVRVYGNLYANVLRLEGAEILSPQGAYWDGGFICDEDGNTINDYLNIGMKSFDLCVAGVWVGTHNANNITGEGISGHVYYDETSNTLTLDNATLVYDNDYIGRGIQNLIDGLTINLVGENYINTNRGEGIRIYGPCENMSITGNGSLNIASGHGITSDVPVEVSVSDGCSVIINALYTGIRLDSGTLVVDHADLSTAANNNGSLYAADLQLVGVDITAPEGAYWQDGKVYNANGTYVTNGVAVVIGNKEYDLWVAGVRVNSTNAIKVEGSGIDGNVSYDSRSNTLTLDNASITYFNDGYGYAIDSELNDLTINLIGENNMRSDNDGISISGNTTIKGDGIINIESNYGIISYEAIDLTISDGCQVNITGGNEGLSLYSLIVDNARVTVSGERFKSVNAQNLQLIDVEIASPEGAYWDGSAVVDAQGSYVTEQVVIATYNIFHGMVSTDWNEPDNWTNRIVPNANNSITIDAVCTVNDDVRVKSMQIADDATVYVLAGQTLSAESVTDTDASQLVVDEGAEVTTTTSGTKATVRKSVDAWGENTGWNLIAAPIVDAGLSTNTTLTDQGDFDLYSYDETNHSEQEWVNYKAVPFESLTPGRGYLFANDMDNWHQFTGELNAEMVSVDVTYTPESGYPLSGFNLIGNPFAHNIHKGSGCAIDDSNLEEGFYTLGDDGEWQAQADGTPIAPCQAILVRTNATTTLNIANTTAAPGSAKGKANRLKLTVEGNRLTDQAFIMEGEGKSLKKIAHVNPNAPTLYVKDGEKDCAIAFTNGEKELTLCFKAKTAGSYTLRLDETTIGKGIIRLTDTLTGKTVKLRAGETYTFTASPDDSAERFTVMMK